LTEDDFLDFYDPQKIKIPISLLHQFEAIDTRIESVRNALLVYSILSNNRSVLVKYNLKIHQISCFESKEIIRRIQQLFCI